MGEEQHCACFETDLDNLFMGVDFLTDNHTYAHSYSINNIVSGSHYTHKIDELNILWACLFTNILIMHSLDVSTVCPC